MSASLPRGWDETTLGEIAVWGSGGTPSRSNTSYYGGDIPWIKTGELGRKYLEQTEEFLTDAGIENSSAKIFPKGSIAVAMYGATIGKTSILGIDAATNQACAVAIPRRGVVDGEFLYYMLVSLKNDFVAAGQGGAQPNISQTVLKKWPAILPPLQEQKRIADKLDGLLAAVDTCKARLDKIPSILKRFRQSVLAAATSGALTEEWRLGAGTKGTGAERVADDARRKAAYVLANPELAKKKSSASADADSDYIFDIPDSWAFTTWGAVSEWVTYGFTRPMPATKDGVRLVTAKDVHPQDLRLDNAGWTSPSSFSKLSDKDRPRVGDLLITKDGTIGRSAVVNTDEPFCINQSVAVCWLRSTQMNRKYLEIVANAGFTQRFVLDKASGMAIQHLSITDFARCPIPVAPDEEQVEIVRRVESLLSSADRIEKRLQAARDRVEKLTQSLLAKAFRGGLVPQDPNDEPAEQLLKKMRNAITASSHAMNGQAQRKRRASRGAVTITRATTTGGANEMVKREGVSETYLTELLKKAGPMSAEALWRDSQLAIDDFYDQLKDEESRGFLKEVRTGKAQEIRLLEATL